MRRFRLKFCFKKSHGAFTLSFNNLEYRGYIMPPPPSSEMRIKKIIRTKVNTAYRLQMSMQYDTEEKLLNVTVHQAVVHGKSWSLY